MSKPIPANQVIDIHKGITGNLFAAIFPVTTAGSLQHAVFPQLLWEYGFDFEIYLQFRAVHIPTH